MVTVREVEGVKNHLIFFSRSQTAKKAPNTHNTNTLAAQCVDICT